VHIRCEKPTASNTIMIIQQQTVYKTCISRSCVGCSYASSARQYRAGGQSLYGWTSLISTTRRRSLYCPLTTLVNSLLPTASHDDFAVTWGFLSFFAAEIMTLEAWWGRYAHWLFSAMLYRQSPVYLIRTQQHNVFTIAHLTLVPIRHNVSEPLPTLSHNKTTLIPSYKARPGYNYRVVLAMKSTRAAERSDVDSNSGLDLQTARRDSKSSDESSHLTYCCNLAVLLSYCLNDSAWAQK